MKISFKEEKFKTGKLYRLEIIRKIRKDDEFKFLTINFFELHDNNSIDRLKNLSNKHYYPTYFDYIGKNLVERSVILDIEIEYLYILSAGSIWKASSSTNIQKIFEPTKAQNIMLSSKRKHTTYQKVKNDLAKSAQFKYLLKDNNLSLLSIPNSIFDGEEVTVLIPHSEIVRHYFSGSGHFIRHLFMEDELSEVATLVGTIEENKYRCSIKLNNRSFPDDDVPFIARGLMDKTTQNAMREIHSCAFNYLMSSKESGYYDDLTELPLKTNLPFEGNAELEVIGHYVGEKDDGEKFFLVRKIQTSHDSWPYEELNMISADIYPKRDRKKYEERPPKEQSSNDPAQPETVTQETPSKHEPQINIIIDQHGRFPFLDNLRIEKKFEDINEDNEKEDDDDTTGIVQGVTVEDGYENNTNQGSLAKENYEKNNQMRRAKLLSEKDQNDNSSYYDTSTIFHDIEREQDGWDITALPIGQVNSSYPYGEFSFRGKKWSQIPEGNTNRNRKGLFLKIEKKEKSPVYCLDIEPHGKRGCRMYLFALPRSHTNRNVIQFVINEINRNGGSGIKQTIEANFNKVENLNHQGDIKNRIIRTVNDLFNE
ncbi:hypothetical protein H0262_00285 [Psychrobacter cryohalolentis]|uniref:hypothetical protein n=1 Tax=Psychrobacter sp. D2 TaxID=2759702 RepID=UPI0015E61E75|nr:hypothetical protein [Psychrobacter sp. D2]MBA2056327.1 hypothetical protein [Psychrobacter sp. D2]